MLKYAPLVLLLLVGCAGVPDEFAQCLTGQGAVMYGTEWCSHCQNQKRAFGSAFKYVNFVDCDEQPDACEAAGVRGYPTWRIDGNNYPGEQPPERLSVLSGCPSPA